MVSMGVRVAILAVTVLSTGCATQQQAPEQPAATSPAESSG